MELFALVNVSAQPRIVKLEPKIALALEAADKVDAMLVAIVANVSFAFIHVDAVFRADIVTRESGQTGAFRADLTLVGTLRIRPAKWFDEQTFVNVDTCRRV